MVLDDSNNIGIGDTVLFEFHKNLTLTVTALISNTKGEGTQNH